MVEPETEIKLEINSEIDENIKLERSESVENKVTTRIRSRNRNQVGPKECHVRKCGCRKVFESSAKRTAHYIEAKLFMCKDCNKVFESGSMLTNHNQSLHGQLLKCRKTQSCGKTFKTGAERNKHETDVSHYKCEICDISYIRYKELQTHHKTECEPLICHVCKEEFRRDSKNNTEFNNHILQCENLKSFICDICGLGFNLKKKLQTHQKLHSEQNTNKKLLSKLKNELLGESRRIKPRKFQCDLCEKSYTTNQKLKFHKLGAHTAVKQFECTYCDSKLTTPYSLSRHLKFHEIQDEDVVAYCKVCSKGYNTKGRADYCKTLHRNGADKIIHGEFPSLSNFNQNATITEIID